MRDGGGLVGGGDYSVLESVKKVFCLNSPNINSEIWRQSPIRDRL